MNRHRGIAAVLSAVIMGAGQIYNRQLGKGLVLLAMYAGGLYFAFMNLGMRYGDWQRSGSGSRS